MTQEAINSIKKSNYTQTKQVKWSMDFNKCCEFGATTHCVHQSCGRRTCVWFKSFWFLEGKRNNARNRPKERPTFYYSRNDKQRTKKNLNSRHWCLLQIFKWTAHPRLSVNEKLKTDKILKKENDDLMRALNKCSLHKFKCHVKMENK